MRILFTSVQLPGHLDWGGYLQTAALLAARGHELLWVSGQALEALVCAAGVPFHAVNETGWRWPPPPALPRGKLAADVWGAARMQHAMDQWLDAARVTTAAAELEAVVATFRPQLIVTEHFVAAAALVAERLDLRLVVAGWPAYLPRATADPTYAALGSSFEERLTRWGSSGRYFTESGMPGLQSPYLHVTYWSPSWYDYAAAGLLGPQTRHVGGRARVPAPPPADFPPPTSRPWVFITLGTAFNRDPAFFSAAASAAESVGAQPIIATGPLAPDEVQAMQRRLPTSAIVRPVVDFAAVLPYAAAAIHHGGAGTTHALITYGVPQVVVPHAGDQMQQALGVAHTAIGAHFRPADVTATRLADVLRDLLPADSPARVNARRLRDAFAALGGPATAADLIEAQAEMATA